MQLTTIFIIFKKEGGQLTGGYVTWFGLNGLQALFYWLGYLGIPRLLTGASRWVIIVLNMITSSARASHEANRRYDVLVNMLGAMPSRVHVRARISYIIINIII